MEKKPLVQQDLKFTPLQGERDIDSEISAKEHRLKHHRGGIDRMLVYLLRVVPDKEEEIAQVLQDLKSAIEEYNTQLSSYQNLLNEKESL